MSRISCLFLCLALAGCNKDREPELSTVQLGRWLCQKSAAEMAWLSTLVHQVQTDMALNGDIYAGSIDGQVMFVHQPLIMSCLACVVYDCDGNRIDTSTIDHQKLGTIIKPQNRIYKAY